MRPLLLAPTGRGAAWLARLSGGQEVPGSNPGAPTNILRSDELPVYVSEPVFRVFFAVGSGTMTARVSVYQYVSALFYGRPEAIGDLVDFIVARILDQLGVAHSLGPRWGATRVAPPTIERA